MAWFLLAQSTSKHPCTLSRTGSRVFLNGKPVIRLCFTIELRYELTSGGADFVFNIQAAHTSHQTVLMEQLLVCPSYPVFNHVDQNTRSRVLRLHASRGPLQVSYQAMVELHHHVAAPGTLREMPVAALPDDVLIYLYPSRYCPSDRLQHLATQEFGHLTPGYARVQAIQAWVQKQVTFKSNTSNSMTSALETLADRVGVCRDFAHLMISLCRALNIPARFTTGIDYGADPALGAPDFHAYVEVYLSQSWYLFDPSGTAIPMGFVRIGTGRDAADAAFATIFGQVRSEAPTIAIRALLDENGHTQTPKHCTEALSTDAGFCRPSS